MIKNFNGELPSYLTVGKEYEGESVTYMEFVMECDNGEFIKCVFDKCKHLNGGSWEVVENE